MSELRQPYRGLPFRPILSLTFRTRDGVRHSLSLLADTGCPQDLILAPKWFDALVLADAEGIENNFGPMNAGWFRLHMPEIGLVELVNGFGSLEVGEAIATELPGVAGLVGLPILRLGEYGGNATDFWFRSSPSTPTGSP